MALARDGKAECMCTGWFKRMVMSTPGFPSPILHPPKMVYEVRQVQGRGLGVLATEDIKAGDLILAERPLLVKMMWNPVRYWKDMTEEEALRGAYVDLENTMEYICSRLTPKDLEAYKSLHNSHDTGGAGPLTGIWRTNGFKLGVKDPSGFDDGKEIKAREYSGVGANASRINHSCSPNAAFSFDMPSFSMEINALRPISKGEEITVAYCAVKIPAAERQNALKPYRFTCTCPACMNPEVSDKERKAAAENLLPKTSQGVKHAEEILAAYEATGLQCLPRYAELLRRVAQINRKKGYKKRADELDAMADIASGKRPRDRTPSTLGSPPEARFMDFGSEEDMMRSIMQIGNPAELANMMSALMRM
ncbi:SET domain-containing protein [Peniophora sp. CONT]|nr:SET domain-containing protein [Peniophora sp. CONT]